MGLITNFNIAGRSRLYFPTSDTKNYQVTLQDQPVTTSPAHTITAQILKSRGTKVTPQLLANNPHTRMCLLTTYTTVQCLALDKLGRGTVFVVQATKIAFL